MAFVLSVDGNTGAGQTTLINSVKDMAHVLVFVEPVAECEELLQKTAINDPLTPAYPSQLKIFDDYAQLKKQTSALQQKNDHKAKIIVVECSAKSGLEIFAKIQEDSNIITNKQFTDLANIHESISILFIHKVLIKTTVDENLQRM